MWLDKARMLRVLKTNRMTKDELATELEMPMCDLDAILNGQEPAEMDTAGKLLSLFGFDAIVSALRNGTARWI